MSAWRPGSRQLSKDELLANARRDTARYWFGSPPLAAPFQVQGRLQVFPLEPSFEKQPWIVLIRDLDHPSLLNDLPVLEDLNTRYAEFGIGALLVLRLRFGYQSEREHAEAWIRKHKLKIPIALDPEGRLSLAFGMGPELHQRTLLFADRALLLEYNGAGWCPPTETRIQSMLRAKDQGLALRTLLEKFPKEIQELDRVEFGPKAPLSSLDYELIGVWWCERDKLTSSDPHAAIRFRSPGSRVSLIAQSALRSGMSSRCSVHLAEAPAPSTFAGADLHSDDEGGVILRIEEPRLYQVIVGVPEQLRDVILKFTSADRAAIQIYGLCLWD